MGKQGQLDYSISTFGYLDYQAQANYYVKYWPDEYGCEEPDMTKPEYSEDKFNTDKYNKAYILRRGNCSFYQKALNAQKANAQLVIVVLEENQDPNTIIPIGPKHRKHFLKIVNFANFRVECILIFSRRC
jgi:hypothetical protein